MRTAERGCVLRSATGLGVRGPRHIPSIHRIPLLDSHSPDPDIPLSVWFHYVMDRSCRRGADIVRFSQKLLIEGPD